MVDNIDCVTLFSIVIIKKMEKKFANVMIGLYFAFFFGSYYITLYIYIYIHIIYVLTYPMQYCIGLDFRLILYIVVWKEKHDKYLKHICA